MSDATRHGGLAGRHAVVTGASRGIGAEVARLLASHGAAVTLMGRDLDALQRVSASLAGAPNVIATADVADPLPVSRALVQARKVLGPIHLLVNNAGQAESRPFQKLDDDHWRQMLGVNLSGAFYTMREALPDMLDAGFGRVVNVASTAGLKGYPYVAAYCAAKHGLLGLTRAVALEVARRGVTVNAVCPGYTDTDLVRSAVANIQRTTGRSEVEAVESLVAHNPQRRLVQPAEVAHVVAWLCLPGAESMNGQAIPVAGGEI
jgi:NAD(P)-dependent dehydrogenase (short-subunit alcohol dehydrogenase family)